MKNNLAVCALLSIILTGCVTNESRESFARLECWGTMREVLREGDTDGHVRLLDVARPGTWGVGALAGLEGEVTITDGNVSLAIVEDGSLVHRSPGPRDQAALLVLATVDSWAQHEVLEARSMADLELVLGSVVREAGFDPVAAPIPVRLVGPFAGLSVHVLDHSCPIADPQGPAPWRWAGEGATGEVIGIFVEGAGGRLTHHGQSFHLHAVVHTPEGSLVSGHVDDLALGAGVRLFLPSGNASSPSSRIEVVADN